MHLSTVGGLFYSFGTTITERIGGDGYLFPFGYDWDDMNIPHLICYTDREISEENCNMAGIDKLSKKQLNPTVNNDYVQLPLHADRAYLYNINGQIILSATLDYENKISVSTLQNGIYFIKAYTLNANSLTFKFIKK